ncbi:hypothetical protein [Spartinivicinus ruber]|uniref:hypothetical protein n=1 Tax=Spartinivicinus ruber TaxID=2683272 RepID=UPI0013D30C31|nr:hypothetical protein [Spartinivicinus ruber]
MKKYLLFFGLICINTTNAYENIYSCPKYKQQEITVTKWVVRSNKTCRGWVSGCYATTSGGYTSLGSAPRFDSPEEAKKRMGASDEFLETVTEKIRVCKM